MRPYRSASSPLMSRIKPKTHADAKKPSRKCLTINHLEQNPSALLAAAISTVRTSRSLCDPTDRSELQLAWVATFVSSLFYAIQKGASSYPSFSWFILAFMFCLYAGMFGTLATRTSREYHVAVVGYLAAGLILTSSAADGLIYSPNILARVAASGFVLLSVLNVCTGFVLCVAAC
jgi:hypothetical protein